MSASKPEPIEAWEYTRTHDVCLPEEEHVMNSLFGDVTDWMHFRIQYGDTVLCRYAISIERKAYFTAQVDMKQLPEPRMKYRNMIISNCVNIGVDPKGLEAIGIGLNRDEKAIGAVKKAFNAVGVEYDNGEGDSTAELVRYGYAEILLFLRT